MAARAHVTVATVLVTLALGGTAFGKTDPVVACTVAKLKATGAAASAIVACHAAAAQKGLTADPECLGAAAAKLAAAFDKAEAAAKKAGSACPTGSDVAETQGEVDAFVTDVVRPLRLQLSASKCVAKKMGSVGKYAQKLLGAHAANRLKADPVKFADKVAKAEAVLTALFAKLDAKAKDCQTSSDEPAMAAAAERLIVTQVCDDNDRCTTDGLAGQVCQHSAITCSEHYACDFRTGSCEFTDCCLMSSGAAFCVVEVPVGQIPTEQAFCQSADAAHADLTLIGVGSQCIGWRATGADDCF